MFVGWYDYRLRYLICYVITTLRLFRTCLISKICNLQPLSRCIFLVNAMSLFIVSYDRLFINYRHIIWITDYELNLSYLKILSLLKLKLYTIYLYLFKTLDPIPAQKKPPQ